MKTEGFLSALTFDFSVQGVVRMKQQIIDRFPGISCAWADATGKETIEYYGFADMESHTYVNEKTIFPACSISKFITAICVMRLHEQKLIDANIHTANILKKI